jgi:Tfp pilus assembly protein PilO
MTARNNTDDRGLDHWHLRKEIPVALIFAIAVQTLGAVWWAASQTERLEQIERRMENAAIRSQNVDLALAAQATQIAVLVERIDTQNRRTEETNNLLRDFLRERGVMP